MRTKKPGPGEPQHDDFRKPKTLTASMRGIAPRLDIRESSTVDGSSARPSCKWKDANRKGVIPERSGWWETRFGGTLWGEPSKIAQKRVFPNEPTKSFLFSRALDHDISFDST